MQDDYGTVSREIQGQPVLGKLMHLQDGPVLFCAKDLWHATEPWTGHRLVLVAYTHSFNPTNDYILTTSKTGWKVLAEFLDTPSAELYEDWQKIIESYSKSD